MQATPKAAPAYGFNYQVSISCSFYVNMGQLTSARLAPDSIVQSTDFSIDPFTSGEHFLSNPSSSWSEERRASTYTKILAGGYGWWKRYEQFYWGRIAFPESHYTFQ